MRKGYRFFMNATLEQKEYLENIGVDINVGINSYILFDDDSNFLIKSTELAKISATPDNVAEYSNEEINTANFFHIELSQQQGYPKPESKYLEIFYDSQFRTKDETYLLIQKEDISAGQISKSIKGLFGIHWLFSEVFADKITYEKYLKPLGIEFRQVYNGTRKQLIEQIVQLKPQGIASEKLKSNYEYEIIGKNKRYIFDYHIPFQGYSKNIDFHYFETEELFGFNDYTYRLPMISKYLYQVIIKNKIKGCRFFPVLIG
ncbi:hypothetical protein JWG40_10345 [Leptospira sp. 201903074]|uniref:hypothetical protein n=1 Tax=Leptospira abararensis TaxID=2810036 RepID=UPI00196595DF|nr:hypothetical protein [Leptospira abararensis]MBM9547418.1 hypothetical protein [Leptospira abararensis]